MKIKELKIGGGIETVEAVIVRLEEKVNKNNGAFLNITISDGESQIAGKKWNTNLEGFPFKEGQAVYAEIKAEEYNGAASYVLRDITESSTDPSSFILSAPLPSEGMYNFLLKTAERCGVYAPVVQAILTKNKERILYWAAGKAVHHNIRGGWLYHTYRMTKIAAYVANIYNKEPGVVPGVKILNPELLIAATILHDIGKLWEMKTDQFGNAENTTYGCLMGHTYIGTEVVGAQARADGLKQEDWMLLQHAILAHHGLKEYGAPEVPAIPEAMVLHFIDHMDAQMWQFETAINATKPGEMSQYVPTLGNRVYRPTWLKPTTETN